MEEAAAKKEAEAPEDIVRGKWFSRPQPEAIKATAHDRDKPGNGSSQLAIGSHLPTNDIGGKGNKKRKEPEPDGFDAW